MYKLIIAILVMVSHTINAADSAKPVTKVLDYKTVGDVKLKMRVYYPPNWKPGGKKLPAVVFFFGGGWISGNWGHFGRQSEHLAKRGMIAICPQYRTQKSHNVTPDKCLEDAKSAMRYVYKNADKLGIDKTRIAAGGGSAGGHLAAATAFCKGFDAVEDDKSITCKPVALVLFNPVIDNSEKGYGYKRVKDYWQKFSPLHNIGKTKITVLFMVGDHDHLIPVATAKAFKKAIDDNGGRCNLIIYPGASHGFFNYGKKNQEQFHEMTIQAMDDFLVKLGYISKK